MPRSKNVDSWMWEQDPSLRQIAEALRDIVLSTEPDLKESIKWSQPVYEKRDNVIYIAATQQYVSLGFFKGTRLMDPEGRIEGTGKNLRHVKVRSLEDIDIDQLRTWVSEAVSVDAEGG